MAKAAEKIEEPQIEDTPAQEPQEVPEQVQSVAYSRFGLAEEKRNHFLINVPHGTDPDDVLETEFWTHIARYLGRGDVVEVRPDDLAWEQSVIVFDRGANWAHVKRRGEIHEYEVIEIESEMPKGYNVEWAGQTAKFRVTFKGEVLKDGFATEAFANTWAANHANALKR